MFHSFRKVQSCDDMPWLVPSILIFSLTVAISKVMPFQKLCPLICRCRACTRVLRRHLWFLPFSPPLEGPEWRCFVVSGWLKSSLRIVAACFSIQLSDHLCVVVLWSWQLFRISVYHFCFCEFHIEPVRRCGATMTPGNRSRWGDQKIISNMWYTGL